MNHNTSKVQQDEMNNIWKREPEMKTEQTDVKVEETELHNIDLQGN